MCLFSHVMATLQFWFESVKKNLYEKLNHNTFQMSCLALDMYFQLNFGIGVLAIMESLELSK